MISNMIDRLPQSSLAILLNAMYFKGSWKDDAFLTDNTSRKPFHGRLGVSEVDMMYSGHKDGEMWDEAPAIIPGKDYSVKVDRPFYFFLKEKSTGACLLSGRIADL